MLDGGLSLLTEPLKPARSASLTDETVGSFVARRTDKRIANNLVSAVFHGIYAGDIWQLSAKTLLALGWQLEARYGSALGGFVRMQNEAPDSKPEDFSKGKSKVLAHPYDVEAARAMNDELDIEPDFVTNLNGASMFTWKNGLQTLVTGLKDAMAKTGNIDIKLDSPVASFKMAEGADKVEIVAGVSPPNHYPFHHR